MDRYILLERIRESRKALEELERVIEEDCRPDEDLDRFYHRPVLGSKSYINRTKLYIRDRFRIIEGHMQHESYYDMVYKNRRATKL